VIQKASFQFRLLKQVIERKKGKDRGDEKTRKKT